ncbi:MAG TPA: trypsin-like peptidase domain-containing protein [Nitrososphaerales archaeon]|nr:trypsin-like peptidase domain-containing protein [Nitrososphaerales archaeon]
MTNSGEMIYRRHGVTGAYWALLVACIIVSSAATLYLAPGRQAATTTTDSQQQLQALINSLEKENADLQNQLASKTPPINASLLGLNPEVIYRQSSLSVVTLQGVQTGVTGNASVLGSGFVTDFLGAYYIVTNYHVVQDVADLTVTFSDGNAYLATVVGTDPYVDLAVVSAQAPQSEFHPLPIGSSSRLVVGEPVVAIGNPFGLSGSMTFGIVSQLGRTLSESPAGNFAIADVIQFSAPINPGNSGGPLLNTNGTVCGITTAVVVSSQGVGFAIPSDVILRELPSLVTTGHYTLHSLMGIYGADMTYQLAELEGTNVTYGVLIQNVTSGGPADIAGLKGGTQPVEVQGTQYTIGGDIIVALNGTKIVNLDALSSYLQEETLPGQTLVIQIIRAGQAMTVNIILGTRPPPPSN